MQNAFHTVSHTVSLNVLKTCLSSLLAQCYIKGASLQLTVSRHCRPLQSAEMCYHLTPVVGPHTCAGRTLEGDEWYKVQIIAAGVCVT